MRGACVRRRMCCSPQRQPWLTDGAASSALCGAACHCSQSQNCMTSVRADTSMGLWMLAFDVTFFDDTRLCSRACDRAGVAFWHIPCTGARPSLPRCMTARLCRDAAAQGCSAVDRVLHFDAPWSTLLGIRYCATVCALAGITGLAVSGCLVAKGVSYIALTYMILPWLQACATPQRALVTCSCTSTFQSRSM